MSSVSELQCLSAVFQGELQFFWTEATEGCTVDQAEEVQSEILKFNSQLSLGIQFLERSNKRTTRTLAPQPAGKT